MLREFDCERCGVHVLQFSPDVSDEPLHCSLCQFIEGIENDKAKADMAAFFDRKNADY